MDLKPIMVTAAGDLAAVVDGIKPDQYDAPTPCPDWDVRAALDHLMWVFDGAGERRDYALDEFRPMLDAFVARDWVGTVNFASRPMPAELVASLVLSDLLVHAWDLARATGQPFTGDDAVVATVHEFCAGMAEQGRTMGAFGPEVAIPESAPLLDRTLGLTGRDPAWVAPTR